MRSDWQYPNLWAGCVGAWCPSQVSGGNRLMDLSGRNNHGTLTNMDPMSDWVNSGGVRALDFDGSNDGVLVPSNASLDLNGAFTVCCWLLFRGSGTQVAFSRFPNSGFSAFWLGTSSGNFVATVNSGSAQIAGAATTGVWVHLAATRGTTNLVTPFLNGVPGSTATVSGAVNAGSVGIGRFGDGAFHWNGLVDDARIYNRALTPQEIRILASRRGAAYQTRRIARGFVADIGGMVGSKKLNELAATGTLASKYAATNGLTLNQLLSADVSVFN